jgi:hypothetical protein
VFSFARAAASAAYDRCVSLACDRYTIWPGFERLSRTTCRHLIITRNSLLDRPISLPYSVHTTRVFGWANHRISLPRSAWRLARLFTDGAFELGEQQVKLSIVSRPSVTIDPIEILQ